LVALRGALIRTGIGALIVGAGELVYQFSQLVARVGGVGEAFRLVGDLPREVWSRMGLALDAAWARMAAGEGLKAARLVALKGVVEGVVAFGDRTAAIFQGAYDAAVAIWGSLPGAIGDFAFQAANGLIAGVEAMLNSVISRINSLIERLNSTRNYLLEWLQADWLRIGTLGEIDFGRIANPFADAAAAAGAAAARAGFSRTSCTRAGWSARPVPAGWSRRWPSPMPRACTRAAGRGSGPTRFRPSSSAGSGCCRAARRGRGAAGAA
jgi:hypothetical protein